MSDSDIEIKKIAPMKPVKKAPPSPTEELLKAERKMTTKAMIHDALTVLKTRKGVSIQAIKKYMEDKYNIETDKVKYLIKKTLKSGVEDGSIIQLKGIGASGSFKLAAVKEKPKMKPKPKKEKPKKEKSTKEKSKDKPMKDNTQKNVKEKPKTEKMKAEKKVKMDVKSKEKQTKEVKKMEPVKKTKGEKELKEKVKSKMARTPKKKAMMKRKSIGSIIKPPKMKPKSKA